VSAAQRSKPGPPRSSFVTLAAWFGIVTAGCAAPMALVQSLMVGTLSEQIRAALDSDALAHLPLAVRYVVEHMGAISLAFLVGSIVTLACSIGLLKRKEWGRQGVVLLLVVAIVQQVALFWIQISVVGEAGTSTGLAEMPRELGAGLLAMEVLGGVLTVLQIGVCGWMIWKLRTPAIRAEFGPL
jgi:hypothetical protein